MSRYFGIDMDTKVYDIPESIKKWLPVIIGAQAFVCVIVSWVLVDFFRAFWPWSK